jgi:hypothetical protein
MQSDRTAPASLRADEFFALVEASLTAPLAALGYHRIQGSVNDQPGSRGPLTSSGGAADEVPFLWFEVGYEAGSDEVTRLVGPRDPQSEEEWWVNYQPSTGRLELGAWEPVAGEHVDWDIRRDDGPCSPSEVQRRLAAVGRAISAFVKAHGGFPITP